MGYGFCICDFVGSWFISDGVYSIHQDERIRRSGGSV